MGLVENQPHVDSANTVNILADALVSDYANIVFDLIAQPVQLSLSLGLGAWVGKLGWRKGWVGAGQVSWVWGSVCWRHGSGRGGGMRGLKVERESRES